jgi:hypothetical protein
MARVLTPDVSEEFLASDELRLLSKRTSAKFPETRRNFAQTAIVLGFRRDRDKEFDVIEIKNS